MPRRRKSSNPARASGGSMSPSTALRRASYCATNIDISANASWRCSSRSFFSSDSALDRPGVDVEVELLPNQLCEFARSHGLPRDELLLDECQCLAPKLVGAMGTALLRHQPGKAGFVKAGLGLVVRRSRHPVFLGDGADRRVVDRDTAQHLVLDLNDVVRIEELVLVKLRIPNIFRDWVQRPLLAEGFDLQALALVRHGHGSPKYVWLMMPLKQRVVKQQCRH